MITPINGHILIEPIKLESFMASQVETYQEVGTIVAVNDGHDWGDDWTPEVGERVYFDSWLAAKYPKNATEYYWLVKWEDVRAIEHAESQ